jgi:hypothetical protein
MVESGWTIAAIIVPHFSFTLPPNSGSSCKIFSFTQSNTPAKSFVETFSLLWRIQKRDSVGCGWMGVTGGNAVRSGWWNVVYVFGFLKFCATYKPRS